MSTLKERVEECERRRPGVSRADVARAAGVKQPSVADWFNGKTARLKLAPAVGAARAWGCDPLWLGEGIGSPGWTGEAPAVQAKCTAQPGDAIAATLDALQSMSRDERRALADDWSALLLAPDSSELRRSVVDALLGEGVTAPRNTSQMRRSGAK